MVNYENAIKRPFTNFGKLAIGILLSIVPVISFIANGYILECAKNAVKKELPDWKNFWGLFVKGLLMLVIDVVYMIPAIILFLISIGTAINWKTLYTVEAFTNLILGAGPLIVIAVLFSLLMAYVIPMAVLVYAMGGKLREAFKVALVFKKAFTGKYAINWLFAVVYSIVIMGIAGIIPVVGSAIGSFIAGITAFTVLGEAYKEI